MMTTEQKFDCVFCQETFNDKETLQIHFRKHGDPKFGQNTKVAKSRTQNESVGSPVDKINEEIEMVGCDVCDEEFPTISKAITHKHKMHPDHEAKYFCPFCGKLFTMKHLHNKHILSNHNSEEVTASKEFHCDMCEVTFNVPSAMIYHNKFFHRQDTEIPAIGSSKKVKLFNQEMVQIYYCSFCGEEFNNKVNLHKHIGEDHCDENQSPNEVLRCPLCESIFYHLDAYEIHLTFHSSEDLYSEKNDLVNQITEFSLETVAPIMENVIEEDFAAQTEEDNMNPDEINNFLQLVMGDQTENPSMEKVKHKKHKKHKKSKKSSITLDEFLNMNKHVFGDGLGDVQGIEEVPTQVVLKKVKGKAQNRKETKMVNADLAKLKKQGIIVKTKPKHNIPVIKTNTSKINQLTSSAKQNMPNNALQESPSDILTKLLKQGNNQIKIVKKSASPNVGSENDNTDSVKSDMTTDASDQINITANKFEDSEHIDSKSNIPELNTPLINCTSNYSETSNNEVNHNETSKDSDFIDQNTIAEKQLIAECSKTCDKVYNPEHENNPTVKEKSETSNDRCTNSNPGKPLKYLEETEPNTENNYVKEGFEDSNINDEVGDTNSHTETETNHQNKTINVLKHLSHLITVKSLTSQNKLNITDEANSKECQNSEGRDDYISSKNLSSEQNNPLAKLLKSCGEITFKNPTQVQPSTSLDAQSDFDSDSEHNDDVEYNDGNIKSEKKNDNANVNKTVTEMKEIKLELVPLPQSVCNRYLLKKHKAEESNNVVTELQTAKTEIVDSPKEACNLDILKRLPNVTAKPLNIAKVAYQQPNQSLTSQNTRLQPKRLNKGIDEDIEVFNIDDSDEETTEINWDNEKSELKSSGNISTDVLKNISKGITVKSSETKNNPNVTKNIKLPTNSPQSDCYTESYTQIKQSKEIQRSINLQNKLKTLGNITIKSNTSSPKDCKKTFEDYEEDQADSCSDDENPGKIKITEVGEDYMSDDDMNEQQNAIVESPNASNSENEDNNDDFNDDLPDFESHIKLNTLKKNEGTVSKNTMPNLDNFKNLNKALTIKSINTKNTEQISNPDTNKEVPEDSNTSTQLALKPYKPNISQNEPVLNKNIPYPMSGSSNQTSLTQKVNSSSNQLNNTVKTVNTVKRFQSQTVIEEITTTVTKTIRTVNSSTNEVMQSTSQNTPKSISVPHKKIMNQQSRGLQGTPVRHATPTIGTKIRNAVPVTRAPNATIVRPSNQLVTARPMFNRPRFPTPSTSAVRKIAPPRCSPAIGKLKISPQALSQTQKRPFDETFGHFMPFKKPKDSITVAQDLPQGFDDDDSSMQHSSTYQSRSDFSSVTKKAKGTVTATQTRSEVSTSSQQQTNNKGAATATQMRSEVSLSSHQQLSRLNNMTGLKVVKSSSKQAVQVEEKCELSPGKRNTLEALEKLQRQGLLVKKPRIEEDKCNSFSESDDEFGEK